MLIITGAPSIKYVSFKNPQIVATSGGYVSNIPKFMEMEVS